MSTIKNMVSVMVPSGVVCHLLAEPIQSFPADFTARFSIPGQLFGTGCDYVAEMKTALEMAVEKMRGESK